MIYLLRSVDLLAGSSSDLVPTMADVSAGIRRVLAACRPHNPRMSCRELLPGTSSAMVLVSIGSVRKTIFFGIK